jgi:uncharacterized protein (TIGR02246 family)
VDDEDQIRRTIAEYSHRWDDGSLDEFADLFTEDAQLLVMGTVNEGRDGIREYMKRVGDAGRGLHVTTNVLVDVEGDSANAVTGYLFVRQGPTGPGITAAGRYHDQLVRGPDRWRFSIRAISMLVAGDRGGDD